MIRSNKAIVWISFVEIVLALIVIGASAYFFVTIYNMMSASQQGQITMSNFNGLANAVQQLIDDPAKFKAERNFPFYIEPEYAVVGFNKGVLGINNDCDLRSSGGFGRPPLEKPFSSCGESACLCLYKKNKPQLLDANLIKCVQYSKLSSIFVDTTENTENMNNNYMGGSILCGDCYDLNYYDKGKFSYDVNPNLKSLAIFGMCKINNEFKLANLYIEKYINNDKLFVMISEETSRTEQRANYLSKI